MEGRIQRFYGRLGFQGILVVWVALVLVFAVCYFLLGFAGGKLSSGGVQQNTGDLQGFLNCVYFSFVTATSLGYGDIFPIGITRVFAVTETILTLLLFGVVISKLVSIKQDVILSELYNVNYRETYDRINRRLHNFNSNARALERDIKAGSTPPEELLDELDTSLMLLDADMLRVKKMLSHGRGYEFLMTLEDSSIELLLNNIFVSLERLQGVLLVLDERGIDFRSAQLKPHIRSILDSGGNICLMCIPKRVSEGVIEKNKRVSEAAESVGKLLEKA